MTDSMTALHLILVQLTYPGDQRVKAAQFQSICNLCRESHKTQVWLCFLVVSFLSISTCAASDSDIKFFPKCIRLMTQTHKIAIQKSDVMLYAPSSNDIKSGCEAVSLKCFIRELRVVLNEEEIDKVKCIFEINDSLLHPTDGCPECETYPLKNTTVFLKRLEDLLKQMHEQKSSNQ